MASIVSSDNEELTKAQKTTPAALLKQLRATAAIMCYDHVFGLPTMVASEFQAKMINMYHGNEDLNIVSQVDLMCGGKGKYMNMYNIVQTVVTNPDAETNESGDHPSSKLVLCPALLSFDTHIRYISGDHFTSSMLKCPTKALTKKCSGRFLFELSKQTVANMKKASIIADEWLVNNEKPSGTMWEDLYRHLIDNAERINRKEKVFTGLAAFICF